MEKDQLTRLTPQLCLVKRYEFSGQNLAVRTGILLNFNLKIYMKVSEISLQPEVGFSQMIKFHVNTLTE